MMAIAMMVELQLAFQGNWNQSDSDETKLSFIGSFPLYLGGEMIERTHFKDPAASMAPDQAERNQALLDLRQACLLFRQAKQSNYILCNLPASAPCPCLWRI